jgi:hypothetical protein
MRLIPLLILLPAALLAGCETSAVNEDYGKAVEHVREAQIYDRSTLNGQADRPVESVDPETAKLAIDSLRKDTPDRATVRHDAGISVSTPAAGGSQ